MSVVLDGNPVTSIFCVVYQLRGAEWTVIGTQGWSQIYLTKNDEGVYRLIGWAKPEDPPIIDCQITSTARYKKRSDDFHRLVDSMGTTWGLGFYTKGDSVNEANAFHDTIIKTITLLTEKEVQAALEAANRPIVPKRPSVGMSNDAGNRIQQSPGAATTNTTNPAPSQSLPPRPAAKQSSIIQYSGGEFVQSPFGNATARTDTNQSGSTDAHTSTNDNALARRPTIPTPGSVSAVAGTVVDNRPAPPTAPPLPNRRSVVAPNANAVSPASDSKSPHSTNSAYAATVGTLGRLRQLPEKPLKQRTASVVATMNVSPPFAVSHERHAVFDPVERKFKGLPEDWEAQINRSFGVSLTTVDSIKLDIYPARIPTVMYRLRERLAQVGGLSTAGIFRVSPASDELDRCRLLADEGKVCEIEDPFTVAALVKMYLRELPVGERLLDHSNHDLVSVCSSPEQAWRIVLEIPEPYHSLFVFLLDLCVAVAKNQAVTSMPPKNLGVCFAPNLFSHNMDDIASLVFSDKVSKFIGFSVEYRLHNPPSTPAGEAVPAE